MIYTRARVPSRGVKIRIYKTLSVLGLNTLILKPVNHTQCPLVPQEDPLPVRQPALVRPVAVPPRATAAAYNALGSEDGRSKDVKTDRLVQIQEDEKEDESSGKNFFFSMAATPINIRWTRTGCRPY